MPRKSVLETIMAAAGLLFLLAGPPLAAGEDEPTISLVQTIEVKEFEGYKFNVEDYTVKRGDALAYVLQKRGVIGQGLLPEQLVRMIKALNPDLKNLDVLLIGQKLVLPSGPIEGLSPAPPQPVETKAPEPAVTPKAAAKTPGAGEYEYRTVRVEKGDRLAEILRREGVPEPLIFNEMVNLVVRVNPQLRNPNLIYAGMDLKVPVKSDWTAVAVVGRKEGTGRAGTGTGTSAKAPASATRVAPARTAKAGKKPVLPVPAPELPSSKHLG
ncbi:MAG: LysM peptidoglycan-binding domain-containing protein, partial [Thermodesulfobacteriota bacterium]